MPVRDTFEADSKAELQEMIDRYLYHYPYQGYMTSTDTVYYSEEKKVWIANMSRLRSCD